MTKPMDKQVDRMIQRFEAKGLRGKFEKLLCEYDARWKGASRFPGGIAGCYAWLMNEPEKKEEGDSE